jgi:phage gp45-like
MRYQQLIYIQNQHQGVRNKDILNVNTSSDICVFNSPLYTISGASKIDCTGVTGTTYVITTGTTIPVTFNFTANTS